jgi:hypothetical protein
MKTRKSFDPTWAFCVIINVLLVGCTVNETLDIKSPQNFHGIWT